jgi:hypothetical protein
MLIKREEDLYEALEEIQESGDSWHSEGIPGPNQDAIRDSSRVVRQLYDTLGILPRRITQTVEEGIYIDFTNGHRTILEIYNEGGAAIVVTDHKDILDSFEIPVEGRVDLICRTLVQILKN